MPASITHIETRGKYLGQCRQRGNVMEQWDGEKWRPVPSVVILPKQDGLHYLPVRDEDWLGR